MLPPSAIDGRQDVRKQGAATRAVFPVLAAAILLNMIVIGIGAPLPAILVTYVLIIIAAFSVERDILPGHVILLISAIPSSFTNLAGGDYSTAPVSLFNGVVFSMLGFTTLFALTGKLKLRNSALSWVLVALGVAVVIGGARTTLVSPNVLVAIKDLATVISVVMLWSVAAAFRVENIKMDVVEKCVGAYLSAVAATSIFVLIQGALYIFGEMSIGVIRGSHEHVRIGFQALFSDMSVLSVYLASGAAMIVGHLVGRRQSITHGYPVALHVILMVVLAATLLTSARAGLVAFIVSIIVVFFNPFLRGMERIWIASRGALLGGVVALISYIYVASLGFRKLPWSASGLIDVNRINLITGVGDFFWNNSTVMSLLFGTAFGSVNHAVVTGLPFTPHNFVLEGFLNGGLIMLAYLATVIGMALYSVRQDMVIALPVLAILAGALVSPSMIASRYLGVMMLIGLLHFFRRRAFNNARRAGE
jgi:hypothetical protein